jgi:DNA-directed RNA polymerase subunit beta
LCTEHEDFETIVQDVYLGTIPYMTPLVQTERVVVSHIDLQGFLWTVFHANGTKYIPENNSFKGSWIIFTDINSVM